MGETSPRVAGAGEAMQQWARENGVPLGHSIIAHQVIGWCAGERGVTAAEECDAWRLHGMDETPWTLAHARYVATLREPLRG